MGNGSHEEKAEVPLMGFLERRREKKFVQASQGSSLPSGEETGRILRALQFHASNRSRDVRKAIPVVIGSIVAGFVTRGLLVFVVSGLTAFVVLLSTFIAAFLFMYLVTVHTYLPPGIDFTLAGHEDPGNVHSMITLVDYHVPREMISRINQDALNFPVMRDFGPSNLVTSFKYDPKTGDIEVTPAWGAINEYEFITRHQVYHTTLEIARTQARTMNNYESFMDLEIEMRSYDRAVEKLDQIAATLFEPEDARRIMSTLREEIEKDKRDLRVKIYGERKDNQPGKNEAPMANETVIASGKQ
jgi:hypothetical protein